MVETLMHVWMNVLSEFPLVLAQGGGDWGQSGSKMQEIWSPIIGVVKTILVSASGLGLTVGVIYKLMDDDDSGKHSWTNAVMGAAALGLFIGLLAEPIVSTIVGLI